MFSDCFLYDIDVSTGYQVANIGPGGNGEVYKLNNEYDCQEECRKCKDCTHFSTNKGDVAVCPNGLGSAAHEHRAPLAQH